MSAAADEPVCTGAVGGVWREGALLIQMRSSVRPARRQQSGGRLSGGTMTAPGNTYDVIVVGGGISGRQALNSLLWVESEEGAECEAADALCVRD